VYRHKKRFDNLLNLLALSKMERKRRLSALASSNESLAS